MPSLKIIFAGTPEFAATILDALIHSPHQIIAVYTQPDKPAGRGLKLTPSPVKQLALAHHLPIYQPKSLKDLPEQSILALLKPDLIIVTAYGMILPAAVLSIPRLGCINVHPSLLPRWRGAAPIQRTIFAGDKISGVSIMQMDEGLDTGPVFLQKKYHLAKNETSQTLHDQLAKLGTTALLEAIDGAMHHRLHAQPQDHQQSTYAAKITKEEALIDWKKSAQQLENKIRAFNPAPVAYAFWQGQRLRLWQAKAIAQQTTAPAGTLISASSEGVDVATDNGILRLLMMQLPGGKILSAREFYASKKDLLVIGHPFV